MSAPEPWTPGPWKAGGALAAGYIWGPNGEMIGEVRGKGGGLPQDANQRLLAAAPEMAALLARIETEGAKCECIVTIGSWSRPAWSAGEDCRGECIPSKARALLSRIRGTA
jgi:hypothetical protein